MVDAARGMTRRAQSRGLDAVLGDAVHLPVADATVDAVLIVDALHHLPDHAAVVAECRRVLRPGGVLVVREFDPGTIRGRLLAGVEHLVGFESTFHSPEALANRLGAAGLAASVIDSGFGYTAVGRRESETHKTADGEG